MTEKAQVIYDFVMERCLWQFFSRNWDREANINNIMAAVAEIQNGQVVDKSSLAANAHYTDAKILNQQLNERFDIFSGLGAEEINAVCDEVRLKLLDIAVTNSLNLERTEAKY